MQFRDAELLSAYLDGQLDAGEVARIEARLAVDAGLRKLLDDLRVPRGLLRRVRRRRAPRNFTLNPLDFRVAAPQPRAVPVLRYAGVLASLLFFLTVGINALTPLAVSSIAAAPAPGFGMGGGGGGAAEVTPEAGLDQTMAAPESSAPALQQPAAPTPEAFAKTAPPAEPARAGRSAPIPPLWIIALAAAGALLVGVSVYLDRRSRRQFHSNLIEK